MSENIPEWSHKINANEVTTREKTKVEISAQGDQCKAIARRIDSLDVNNLSASFVCERDGASVHITGNVKADIVQKCIASLDTINTEVNEDFEAWFSNANDAVPIARARRNKEGDNAGEEYKILDERDDPEPLDENGQIDLGELAAQYLALATPLYPRSSSSTPTTEPPKQEKPNNPFAGLAAWREEQ